MNLQGKRIAKALLSLCILFVSISANAGTINAASCSQSAVQSAINSASAGDTVVIPSCSSTTWSSALTISKSITLQGQTSCTGAGQTLSCTNSTTITFSSSGTLTINASNVRVTGITFRGIGAAGNATMISINTDFSNWRFDHNDIQPSSQSYRCVYVYGGSGLLDHNHFKSCNDGVAVEGNSASDAVNNGDYAWSHTLSLIRNPNAIFIEDNYFDYPTSEGDGAVDAYNGANFIFRYNYVSGTNVGGHGLDSTTGGRSTLNMEVYNNTFYNPRSSGNVYQVVDSRGGTWKVFNNTVSTANSGYGLFLWLHLYRSDDGYGWGNGNTCSSGLNWIDGNSSHGYPCRDQQGRGPETAPSADWPNLTTTSNYSEALFPGYSWSNTFQGSRITGVLDPDIRVTNAANADPPTNASLYQVINNRDFYQDIGSAGDGTSGVGVGLLSARPATCTHSTTPDGQRTGVGYWATDTNTLYQCTATNTWSPYYQPYTYPHPLQFLQSGGATPPEPATNLSAVAK